MVIALDHDYTYGCDPLFWAKVIMGAERHGHERPELPLWPSMPTFCTGREKKWGTWRCSVSTSMCGSTTIRSHWSMASSGWATTAAG